MAAVFFISLWLFLWMQGERDRISTDMNRISQQMKAREAALQAAEQEKQKASQQQQQVVLTDEERKELASARLLIGRRVLSMNDLMNALEPYVPDKTRITGIKIEEVVAAGQETSAIVEVKAAGADYNEMKTMWEKLTASSGPFVVNAPANQEAKNERGELPFTISLTYYPPRGNAQ